MPPVKKARGKKPWVRLKVNVGFALLTLADATALLQTIIDNVDDFFWYSSQLSWSLLNLTAGEGPIEVGLCDGVYSVAQIKEAVDASPTGRSDRIALERTKRSVRGVGQFNGLTTEESLNNGLPVYTKTLINMSGSSVMSAYALNRSNGPLTTGAVINITGVLVGYWL